LDPLLQLWGKARPAAQAGPRWHPLLYHSLDVAAVGERLLEARPSAVVQLAARLGWSAEALTRQVVFLLALHDIGKLSRPFQAKVVELWPEPLLGPLGPAPPRDPGHPVTGTWLLQRMLVSELAVFFPRWSAELIGDLLAPFAGHHGRPVSVAGFSERLPHPVCRRRPRVPRARGDEPNGAHGGTTMRMRSPRPRG
jgi:CRISPR-associated endonuclease/helicase Cas3